jgi:hypothetical protein
VRNTSMSDFLVMYKVADGMKDDGDPVQVELVSQKTLEELETHGNKTPRINIAVVTDLPNDRPQQFSVIKRMLDSYAVSMIDGLKKIRTRAIRINYKNYPQENLDDIAKNRYTVIKWADFRPLLQLKITVNDDDWKEDIFSQIRDSDI